MVVMPLSDELVVLHGDGRAVFDEIISTYERVAEGSGSRLIDLSNLVPVAEFASLTKVTATGRSRISEALSIEFGDNP
jgi:hypothetical protein